MTIYAIICYNYLLGSLGAFRLTDNFFGGLYDGFLVDDSVGRGSGQFFMDGGNVRDATARQKPAAAKFRHSRDQPEVFVFSRFLDNDMGRRHWRRPDQHRLRSPRRERMPRCGALACLCDLGDCFFARIREDVHGPKPQAGYGLPRDW